MTKKKHKILFVLPSLAAGGAERVISFISKNINKDKFESHLLIIGHKSETVYDFNKEHTTFLNKRRVLFAIPNLILFIIKYQPHLVLSSIGHLNTTLALLSPLFFKIKFIIREASVISTMRKFSNKGKPWLNIFSKISYNWVDSVICQSQDMATDFGNLYSIDNNKLVVINNPITNACKIKKTKNKNHNYITIGRLSKEKGHERILNILSLLKSDFHYTIIGDGPEKNNIINQIYRLGLENNITHIPYTNNVNNFLIQHDIFLQGSFVEGFPNAVLESCSAGIPVLAFNAPGGTKEIIENGLNGFIVDTEEEYLMHLQKNYDWNPEVISESVMKKFNQDQILLKYERLFNQVLY